MTMSNDFKLLDVVALHAARPDDGLEAGAKGTIVDVHTNPNLAYEVEFCDGDGRTIAQLALLPSEVELVWSA
jgi:hypothetical protein